MGCGSSVTGHEGVYDREPSFFNGAKQSYQPSYALFPTHISLKKENSKWEKMIGNDVMSEDSQTIEVLPASSSKEDLYDLKSFDEIDKHALEAPKAFLKESLEDVAAYLLMRCETELEKARVLFRWIAAQRLDSLPQKLKQGQIAFRLKRIHMNNDTYAELYEDMCRFAGVECHTVRGVVKAGGYTSGDPVDFTAPRNYWCVVCVNSARGGSVHKQWRPVDIHFAARSRSGGQQGEWNLIDDNGQSVINPEETESGAVVSHSYDDFYFLTNPEEFIYNHFPDDEKYQLLSRPVSQSEFREMAYIRPHFFELGFEVKNCAKGVIQVDTGETIITMGKPATAHRRFMYRLWKASDQTAGNALNQCVFLEQHKKSVTCKVYLPEVGKYKLDMYSRDSCHDDEDSDHDQFHCIAQYILCCVKAKENWKAIPHNHRREWGPGNDVRRLGLEPLSHHDGVIESENGQVTVRFRMNKPVKLLTKLQSDDVSDLTQWVVHRQENKEAVIYVKLLRPGMYALNIYGSRTKTRPDSLPHICTYLIKATQGVFDQNTFPELFNQRTGGTEHWKQFRMDPISHLESVFTSTKGQVDITFDTEKSLQFSTKLFRQRADRKTEIRNHVFTKHLNNKVTFAIRFPNVGLYLFSIFVQRKNTELSFPCVYNYVIDVTQSLHSCKPYPKSYSLWDEGCDIYEMHEGIVATEDDLRVAVKVPNAKDVALIEGSAWHVLRQNQNGMWVGEIQTSKKPGTLKLSASFGDDIEEFSTLLEYQVKSRKELGLMEKDQIEKAKREKESKLKEQNRQRKIQEQFNKLKLELEGAMKAKDLKRLRRVLVEIERMNFTNRLKTTYQKATELLISLERMERLRIPILNMNQKTMAEIRSYSSPPKLVHDVMVASLLILGEHETLTKDWKRCQALCNSNQLKRRVRKFDLEELHIEIAARALEILRKLRLDDVRSTSAGAACFYSWVIGVTEEINGLCDGKLDSTKPANVKRQKTLLKHT